MDEYAQAQGVTLLLEATNRNENNVLNTARELADMIDGYQLAHTRALLDVFHMNMEEADCAQALEDAKHVLGHIHFADDNRMYPGAGSFAFEPFVRKIREIGYDGVLSVECLPLPTPEEAARRARCSSMHGLIESGTELIRLHCLSHMPMRAQLFYLAGTLIPVISVIKPVLTSETANATM